MADYSYIAIEKSGKEIKGSMESDSRSNRNCVRRGVFH